MKFNPAYDISKDYYYNLQRGPFVEEPRDVSLAVKPVKLLGKEVAYPLGVPAGLLLNARWVKTYNRLGFPIVVYKTVRSTKYPCHPWPNCLFVKAGIIDPDNPPEVIVAPEGYLPEDVHDVSITNSFGMPSMEPDRWQEDIDSLRGALLEKSLLVGSGVGTFTGTARELVRDFARVAAMLKEAGVDAVEVNFSCPNVGDGEGSIYTDPELSAEILKAVKKEIKETPLVVKVGLILGKDLEEFVKRCAPYLEGISGINSFQARVVREDGSPALGPGREKSGVCGKLLRKCALRFTRELSEIRRRMKAEFAILSCGGVTDRESYERLMEAGADAVLCCTGAMFNPNLAAEIRGPCRK